MHVLKGEKKKKSKVWWGYLLPLQDNFPIKIRPQAIIVHFCKSLYIIQNYNIIFARRISEVTSTLPPTQLNGIFICWKSVSYPDMVMY